MEFYKPIDIEFEPLTKEALSWLENTKKENYFGDKSFRLLLDVQKHINPRLINYYDQRGFFIKFSEIFYTAIHRESLIHSDSNPKEYARAGDMGKINHISGGVDSLMHWYKPKVEKSYETLGQAKNKYISYTDTEVDLISSAHLQGYNIVQVAPPHNISNHVTQRVCTSMTIRSKLDPDHMPAYQTLVDVFLN